MMDTKHQADIIRIATQTGLEVSTCEDLLTKGWRYIEKRNEIARWEHPMWQLDRAIITFPLDEQNY